MHTSLKLRGLTRPFGAVLSGHGVTRPQICPPRAPIPRVPSSPLSPRPTAHPTAISRGCSCARAPTQRMAAREQSGRDAWIQLAVIYCALISSARRGIGSFPGTHSSSVPTELRPRGTSCSQGSAGGTEGHRELSASPGIPAGSAEWEKLSDEPEIPRGEWAESAPSGAGQPCSVAQCRSLRPLHPSMDNRNRPPCPPAAPAPNPTGSPGGWEVLCWVGALGQAGASPPPLGAARLRRGSRCCFLHRGSNLCLNPHRRGKEKEGGMGFSPQPLREQGDPGGAGTPLDPSQPRCDPLVPISSH